MGHTPSYDKGGFWTVAVAKMDIIFSPGMKQRCYNSVEWKISHAYNSFVA